MVEVEQELLDLEQVVVEVEVVEQEVLDYLV
jgi:hypothetical protein